jgi:hypothetical protein
MIDLFNGPPLYDAASARELLISIGPPEDARDKAEAIGHVLTELGKSFAFALWAEVQASTPEREKQAKRLADACRNVLQIAGVADGGELLEMFGGRGLFAAAYGRGEPSGQAATMDALRAVDLLRQDALKMLEIEGKRRRMKAPKRGRPESAAMQKLVRELSCFYEKLWLRTPGVSSGDSEPSGPLMRLMLDVTGKLRARGIRFTSTPDSLRKVWQRLADQEKMPLTVLSHQFHALQQPAAPLSK